MRRYLTVFVAFALLSACQTTGTAVDALSATSSFLAKRQTESRVFEVKDGTVMIRSIVETLQDFGFRISESNVNAGLVSGSKSAKSGDVFQRYSDVKVTVTISPVRSGRSTVRTNFQKIIPHPDPRLFRAEPITDPKLYTKFYDSVSQSLFLLRNQ